jgi:glycerol-3-phosphate dehydrogenase
MPATGDTFDIAVIGAGVIGCAIARAFVLAGARVVVLEKAPDILDGASKGNSGILHTGFDAPPGSLEQKCIAAGYAEYLRISDRLNLPILKASALVLAWTDEEEASLPSLVAQAHENGVTDVAAQTREQLLQLEPGLSPKVKAGFRVPREYLIDPWSTPHAYLLQAIENGATLMRDCEVKGGGFDGDRWQLDTTRGPVEAGFIVNAAGLYGDVVDERLLGRKDFGIRPRKGQFVVFDKAAAVLASHILLPVPSKLTKGVVVCRTAFGNLIVGPTAEEQEDRQNAVLVPETLEALQRRGVEILPALEGQPVTAIYAGLRPATEFKDYQIRRHDGRNVITVGGIRSTGLSAALGIAQHVLELHGSGEFTPLPDPVWPEVPIMAEVPGRDWQADGHGGIVCHCERVTRREIEAAMEGPLAPQGFGGLKRRTRVTMGRCQGFFCSAALGDMTDGKLVHPMYESGDA